MLESRVFKFPCRNPRGEITIYPCEDMGGSWAVDRDSCNGDSGARIATCFAFDDALKAAKREAERTGATLVKGFEL